MDWVLAILLFLHVAGAVVAFGPTFAFPFIGAMGGKEPQHVNFALRLQEMLSTRLVLPLALLQGVTGLLIVWKSGLNLFATNWLLLAIAIYLTALSIAYFILIPTGKRLVEATSGPPPAPPAGAPAPSGPPPHIAALVKRGRMFGMINAVLILAIIFLMVTKPF